TTAEKVRRCSATTDVSIYGKTAIFDEHLREIEHLVGAHQRRRCSCCSSQWKLSIYSASNEGNYLSTLQQPEKGPKPMPLEPVKKGDEASTEQAARRVAFSVSQYVQEYSFPERERFRAPLPHRDSVATLGHSRCKGRRQVKEEPAPSL